MKTAVEISNVYYGHPSLDNTRREMLLEMIAQTIRQFPVDKQREIIKRYTAN